MSGGPLSYQFCDPSDIAVYAAFMSAFDHFIRLLPVGSVGIIKTNCGDRSNVSLETAGATPPPTA